MSCQLPADCLNEIFEYLEQDKISLHSCLLVNCLWFEISVRILWRDIWSFNDTVTLRYRLDVLLQIFSTLVSCLPNESKDLLLENGIFITTPTWKRSLFNYASFCKVLSIHKIDQMIQQFLEKQQFINSQSLKYNKYLLSQEILKMFMKQSSSLRSLDYIERKGKVENTMFHHFPGAKNCLADLTELTCSSNIQSEFFYRVSQLCHNIQSLTIDFSDVISNGLADLISLQNNLKNVTLLTYYTHDEDETKIIISSLTKISSTLIKFKIIHFHNPSYIQFPLSFIATFKNLQELILSLNHTDPFYNLQHVTFPQLKILKFLYINPKVEALTKFLELNGKNLREFCVCGMGDNSLYLAVAKFCPNIQTLSTAILNNEIDTLKAILNSCQYLESIKVWCDQLNEKELLAVIAKHSPKNFNELKLYYFCASSGLLTENLEAFLVSWNNRISKRSISLIGLRRFSNLKIDDESMKLIEKYKKLGIIKKFKIEKYNPGE